MRKMLRLASGVASGLLVLGGGIAMAQTFNSGSTGADGPFSPTATTTLTLPPSGVFNFTTVNIPSSVTVRFTKNAANTPVTILASGDVTIAGTIDVSGSPGGTGSSQTLLAPSGGSGGPGGFSGGSGSNGIASTIGGAGLGPGGGSGNAPGVAFDGGGGFGTAGSSPCGPPGTGPAYGTATLPRAKRFWPPAAVAGVPGGSVGEAVRTESPRRPAARGSARAAARGTRPASPTTVAGDSGRPAAAPAARRARAQRTVRRRSCP